MSLKRNVLDLRKRKEIVLQGGGEEAIKKQAAMGKLTARERIEAILDKDSFHEYDMFVEHQSKDFDMDKKVLHGDGVIIGTGTIYGELVCIYAQDFTVAGGSLGLMHARKITKIIRSNSSIICNPRSLCWWSRILSRLDRLRVRG